MIKLKYVDQHKNYIHCYASAGDDGVDVYRVAESYFEVSTWFDIMLVITTPAKNLVYDYVWQQSQSTAHH